MDVHAPHQPVHTWRDFAVHLTIVTIGLFIALSLEAMVEHLHNLRLVREARANIRQELSNDHDSAQHDLDLLQQNIDRQKANIVSIHRLMAEGERFKGGVHNTMVFDSLDDAAWHTARDTGALGFMPYAEVQRYSDLYTLATVVNDTSTAIGKEDFVAAAPFEMGYDIGKLPPEQYTHLLEDNARIQIQLDVLRQIVKEYDDNVVAELKNH